MKVTVHAIKINCPQHGEVPYTATSDWCDEVVTVYCPRCKAEGRDSKRKEPELNNIAETQWEGDDPKITLYRRLRSVGETIQLYEDADEKLFIKTGMFYREIEIDDDGHIATLLGRSYLENNVRVEWKKLGTKPRAFA